jgi:hypothetical protein
MTVLFQELSAQVVTIDGYYYLLDSETHSATFTYQNKDTGGQPISSYSGDIIIPEFVSYQSSNYTVTTLGSNVFYYCNINSLQMPNTIKTIESEAFCNTTINSLTIPKNVETINQNAFYRCRGLNSIVVDKGNSIYDSRNNCNAIIETSSDKLLLGCYTTVIPNDVKAIEQSAFHLCEQLKKIVIPNSVTSIGRQAFQGCTQLESVTLSENLTEIPSQLFYDCTSLKKILFPKNITAIGAYVFMHCTSMEDVYCYGKVVPQTIASAFTSGPVLANMTLHVDKMLIEQYRSTEPWSLFGTIVPLTEEDMSVENITDSSDNKIVSIYNFQGHRIHSPLHGLNIIRKADDTVRKVIIK